MQEQANYLNSRQKVFCHWYALTRNAEAAAARCWQAPEKQREAVRLLESPPARQYLKEIEAALSGSRREPTVEEGYRKLAFGPVSDAVRLMFPEEGRVPEIEGMDLFNIAKISAARGGLEITFFDRLEALDRLSARQKEEAAPRDAFGFLDAVAAGAAALEENG